MVQFNQFNVKEIELTIPNAWSLNHSFSMFLLLFISSEINT
jgi:hypothetical protein